MSHDAVNNWVEKAKAEETVSLRHNGIQIIRREQTHKSGNMMLEIADKICPWLIKMFDEAHDDGEIPARVRSSVALSMAHNVKIQNAKEAR